MDATTEYASIYSPNFPEPYFSNADCYWVIHAPTEVELKVVVLDLETGYDTLRLYDGDSADASSIRILTGTIQQDFTFFSQGPDMYIRFQSNEAIARSGFHVQYRDAVDKGKCESEPCQNGGSCFTIGTQLPAQCMCPDGTGGDRCECKTLLMTFEYWDRIKKTKTNKALI